MIRNHGSKKLHEVPQQACRRMPRRLSWPWRHAITLWCGLSALAWAGIGLGLWLAR